MKPMIARLLGSLAFLLGVAGPAWAQEPAKDFTGWLCEIDLTFPEKFPNQFPDANLPDGIPPSVFTTRTRKHCPGNVSTESVTTECLTEQGRPIPGWTGSASTNQNVPCQINGDQCGVPGLFNNVPGDPNFSDGVSSSLNIDGNGNARLFCKLNP